MLQPHTQGFLFRMSHYKVLITGLLLALTLPACAESNVYEWQDSAGGAHYSDAYHPQAKRVTLKSNDALYTVKTVYDGDTVQLEDGRKIRFLGINTPEIQHRNKAAEEGGYEAKAWLSQKLQNTRVRLEFDVENTDKYGRTLAYLVTENHEVLNISLVKAGLAAVSIFPPNLLYVQELSAAQQYAEQHQLGIWKAASYAVIPVERLTNTGHFGWTRLVGKVQSIRESDKFIFLVFNEQFEVRIERESVSLFPDLKSYVGKVIEVRGWLNKNKDHFSILIRHPSAMI